MTILVLLAIIAWLAGMVILGLLDSMDRPVGWEWLGLLAWFVFVPGVLVERLLKKIRRGIRVRN